jgi:hypothetical protein
MSVLWHSMPTHRSRSTAVALLSALTLGATACGGAGRPAAAAGHHAAARADRSTTTTAAPPAPEEAVRRAYLQSWDDYARAVWNLDPRGLERTYASDGLADVEIEIQQRLRSRNRCVVDVTHDLTIEMIDDTRASVTDRTVEASVDYDADTRVPVETRAPHPRLFQMILEKIDGHWKVVFTA